MALSDVPDRTYNLPSIPCNPVERGFLLFQLLIWAGLVTEILKVLIAFPRPDFVDN